MAVVQLIRISKSVFIVSLLLISVFYGVADSYRTKEEYECIDDASSCRGREIPDLMRIYSYTGFLRLLERKSIAELCGNAERYFKCSNGVLLSEQCRHFDGLNNYRSIERTFQSFSGAFCSDIPVRRAPPVAFITVGSEDSDWLTITRLEKFWNCLQDVTREPCGQPVINFIKATWDRYNELEPKCLGNAAKGEYSGILKHLKAINKNFI